MMVDVQSTSAVEFEQFISMHDGCILTVLARRKGHQKKLSETSAEIQLPKNYDGSSAPLMPLSQAMPFIMKSGFHLHSRVCNFMA